MVKREGMSRRFAYSSLFWKEPDIEREIAHLATTGWPGWEARQSLDCLGTPTRIGRLCESAGVALAAVCGLNATLKTTDASHEINKRRIEFTADCGTEIFMTKGPGRLQRSTTDDDLLVMAAVYDDLSLYGKKLGVTVVFHPHINHVVNSADEWRRFMRMLKHCRLCLDMSHAVHWGLDPVATIEEFGQSIAYVHLHDYKADRSVELGEGSMCDYAAFLNRLTDIDYRGWVTVCPGQSERTDHEKQRLNHDYLVGLGY